jgi:hypothetical protein
MTERTPTETDFETEVARIEANAPIPTLYRVIERRATIARLRSRRVGWSEIAALLAGVGIAIGPGTLRNYASRIALAVSELGASDPEPSDARIYEQCRLRARPGQGRSERSRAVPSTRSRPAKEPGTASLSHSVIRNHDEVL